MFIVRGRTFGALAAILCAGVVAYALGGCASQPSSAAAALLDPIDDQRYVQCAFGTTRACVAYGPRGQDVRCGCDDAREAEAALARLTGQ